MPKLSLAQTYVKEEIFFLHIKFRRNWSFDTFCTREVINFIFFHKNSQREMLTYNCRHNIVTLGSRPLSLRCRVVSERIAEKTLKR